MYLGWYEADGKGKQRVSPDQKLRHACGRYERKFGRAPSVALVSPDVTLTGHSDLTVLTRPWVAKDVFLVGEEESYDGEEAD